MYEKKLLEYLKKSTHSSLIVLLKAFGYKHNVDGACAGIAWMGMQALQQGDAGRRAFNERIDTINQLILSSLQEEVDLNPDEIKNQFQRLIAAQSEWWASAAEQAGGYHALLQDEGMKNAWLRFKDLDVFAQNVSFYFNPKAYALDDNFSSIFQGLSIPREQEASVVEPLLRPIGLSSRDGRSGSGKRHDMPSSITRLFVDADSMRVYFEALKRGWVNDGLNQVVTLFVTGNSHAISIGFDPRTNAFSFVDANRLPIYSGLDAGQLSYLVSTAYMVSKKNPIILNIAAQDNEMLDQHTEDLISRSLDSPLTITDALLNLRNPQNASLLSEAIKSGDLSLAERIFTYIDQHKDSNERVLIPQINDESLGLMQNAVMESRFKPNARAMQLIDLLLSHGADINLRPEGGLTALDIAIANHNLELVKALVQRQANILDPRVFDQVLQFNSDDSAQTLLEKFRIFRFLIDAGATMPHDGLNEVFLMKRVDRMMDGLFSVIKGEKLQEFQAGFLTHIFQEIVGLNEDKPSALSIKESLLSEVNHLFKKISSNWDYWASDRRGALINALRVILPLPLTDEKFIARKLSILKSLSGSPDISRDLLLSGMERDFQAEDDELERVTPEAPRIVAARLSPDIRKKMQEYINHMGQALASKNYVEVEKMIGEGVNPNNVIYQAGMTALTYAIISNQPESVDLLLNAGASPMVRDQKGFSSVYYALTYRRFDMVEKLMASSTFDVYEPFDLSGRDVRDLASDLYLDAINAAIAENTLDIPKGLKAIRGICLTWGVDIHPEALLANTESLLTTALKNSNEVMFAYLLSEGANPDALTAEGQSLLSYCVLSGKERYIAPLIAAGADSEMQDALGLSALHHAIKNNSPYGFRLLIDASKVNLNDFFPSLRDTPLNYCIDHDCNELVVELINRGVDVNVIHPRTQKTPLMSAISNGNHELISILLKHGADPRLSTAKGDALSYAMKKGDALVVSMIRNYLPEQTKDNAVAVSSTSKIAKSLQVSPQPSSPSDALPRAQPGVVVDDVHASKHEKTTSNEPSPVSTPGLRR